MRPLRLLLSLTSCIVAITLLLYLGLPSEAAEDGFVGPNGASASGSNHGKKHGKLRALFSFHSPSSLFPPSAIISLTDDNSTFFLARPAAFGPQLPNKGLSGQLWVGSGFGDDSLGRGGGVATGAVGELGCSDIPGWDDGTGHAPGGGDAGSPRRQMAKDASGLEGSSMKRRDTTPRDDDGVDSTEGDDGTDDHLHDPLAGSDPASGGTPGSADGATTPEHADIQSLQESAEIAGKVVLLSRGGCGFLAKAKWVQSRGGIALIVGDDIRGGPLVTMYARGDTSNITIPALFTSHTTAHLLSSLIPSGGLLEGTHAHPTGKLGLEGAKKSSNGKTDGNSPGHSNSRGKSSTRPQESKSRPAPGAGKPSSPSVNGAEKRGWFRSLLGLFGFGHGSGSSTEGDSRRPPSSGNIDWVLLEDWDDDEELPASRPKQTSKSKASPKPSPTPAAKSGDDFVIGVQDWRDPDLVEGADDNEPVNGATQNSQSSGDQNSQDSNHPNGGSILPGSGEYEKPGSEPSDSSSGRTSPASSLGEDNEEDSHNDGWLDHLLGGDDHEDGSTSSKSSSHSHQNDVPVHHAGGAHADEHSSEAHDGLWVTLTPTGMSSSPFFDTLLVLVVSPLVTLTVVYALLLLRSRIRRRRWRAPKSVVERLPVRTYHTLSSNEATTTSSPLTTPVTTNPTTPLLHHSSRAAVARPRPRSRTTSEVPEQIISTASTSTTAASSYRNDRPCVERLESSSSSSEQEKRDSGLAEWRRRYGGRQKECVVCLEEYIDGISRVMSLPCGHEFHAECITPWLTTRRRTCPICKGDVVRSMARGDTFGAGSPTAGYDDSDDVQAQAAENRNDSPSAALPLLHEADEFDADVERAEASATAAARGLGSFFGGRGGDSIRREHQLHEEVDRNR
ncbi:hypothetical protein BDY21DRAFT_160739 [Lineolata rhizophorae]|uniref:RING-type E3 ubiquitin transferase n=1 Tax=Lineolata rhizophorae TaxID=578093 RepID=A0A6A6P8Z2_9PEZI|nr:hypothetical protein BDY21DRAFT_160739 [Lineolata rhizophorae]